MRDQTIQSLLEALRSCLDYIDAIPSEDADRFPAMPGFDRDEVECVIEDAKKLSFY